MRPCFLHSFPVFSWLLSILNSQFLEEDIGGIVDRARITLRRPLVLTEPFEGARLTLRGTWRVQLSQQITTESRLSDTRLLQMPLDLAAYFIATIENRYIIVLLLCDRDIRDIDATGISSFFNSLSRLLVGGRIGLLLLRHLFAGELALLEELPSNTICIAPCALHGPMLGKKSIHRLVADTEGAAKFPFLFVGVEIRSDLTTYLVTVLVYWPAIEA